jgi:hypothetical protein
MKQSPLKRRTPLKRGKKSERIPKGADTLERLLGSGTVQRASTFTAKRKPLKKRSPSNAGWVDVAKAIWDDPSNTRCCEVCGVYLGDDFNPTFYHHILHRGSYRLFKRRPDNLAQLCPTDHYKAHEFGIENLAAPGLMDMGGWMRLAERFVVLRNEAHGI